jgi:hypothetical protein
MNVEARLRRALNSREPVRVRRNIRGADVLDGYVQAVGAKWMLLAVLRDVTLDGFVALRLKDIAKAERCYAPKFWRRALELRGEWPPAAPMDEITLDGIRGLLEPAGEALVAVYIEREDPGVCFIGVPVKVTRRRLHLTEVTAKAKWRTDGSRWDLKSITRVDFGDRYMRALTAVAGPRPRN